MQDVTSTRPISLGWWPHLACSVWGTPPFICVRMTLEKENSKNSFDLMHPWKSLREEPGVPDPTLRGVQALLYHWAEATCYFQTRTSVYLKSVSWTPSSAFITFGPGSGITNLINLPLFIIQRVPHHLLLLRSSGFLPFAWLLGSPSILCLRVPSAGPHRSAPGALHSSRAQAPLHSAPHSRAFPLHSFIRHCAEGTSISIRAFLPRYRTCFKWSKEI